MISRSATWIILFNSSLQTNPSLLTKPTAYMPACLLQLEMPKASHSQGTPRSRTWFVKLRINNLSIKAEGNDPELSEEN